MTINILLNPEIISKFNSDGVVLLKSFIYDSWQKLLKEAIEEDIKNPSPASFPVRKTFFSFKRILVF